METTPPEALLTLDLTACARVLEEQQRVREDAARAKREAEEAEQRLREAAARTLAAHVLSQLPAALAAYDCGAQVQVLPPADADAPRGAHDLACRYLDRYFGITDEQAKQESGWQWYGSGPFFVSRLLLTAIVERMVEAERTATRARIAINIDGCDSSAEVTVLPSQVAEYALDAPPPRLAVWLVDAPDQAALEVTRLRLIAYAVTMAIGAMLCARAGYPALAVACVAAGPVSPLYWWSLARLAEHGKGANHAR